MASPLPISERVTRIRAGEDKSLLMTLRSGHAVLNTAQPVAIRGCCMLLPDPVVPALNDLHGVLRQQFLADLALLGDAILAVTGAERINYLVLCNQVPELHGHCIPRLLTEAANLRRLGPFEAYDFGDAPALDVEGADQDLHVRLMAELRRLAKVV